MPYCYDNLKLEKGMYHEAGRSFTQVLESRDPSGSTGYRPGRGWMPFSGSSSALISR